MNLRFSHSNALYLSLGTALFLLLPMTGLADPYDDVHLQRAADAAGKNWNREAYEAKKKQDLKALGEPLKALLKESESKTELVSGSEVQKICDLYLKSMEAFADKMTYDVRESILQCGATAAEKDLYLERKAFNFCLEKSEYPSSMAKCISHIKGKEHTDFTFVVCADVENYNAINCLERAKAKKHADGSSGLSQELDNCRRDLQSMQMNATNSRINHSLIRKSEMNKFLPSSAVPVPSARDSE